MKLIENTYKHNEQGFQVKVTTCNKKLVTTENVETGEVVKFNRGKFEWMISKVIFSKVNV
jgi:hypothetical protein